MSTRIRGSRQTSRLKLVGVWGLGARELTCVCMGEGYVGGRSHADSWACVLAGERPYGSWTNSWVVREKKAGQGLGLGRWCVGPGLLG